MTSRQVVEGEIQHHIVGAAIHACDCLVPLLQQCTRGKRGPVELHAAGTQQLLVGLPQHRARRPVVAFPRFGRAIAAKLDRHIKFVRCVRAPVVDREIMPGPDQFIDQDRR